METEFTQLARDADGVRMLPEEKLAGRNILAAYMSANPAASLSSITPPRRKFFALPSMTRRVAVASVVLAVTLTAAGVSYAAERALPGDALYGVKVGVNEEVFAALSPTPEAKADWEEKRAERRLNEAAELAAKEQFTGEARENIESSFFQHAENVKDRIAEFESDDNVDAAADVATNFETSLGAHERILARLASTAAPGTRDDVADFAKEIASEKRAAAARRVEFETSVRASRSGTVHAAASGRMRAAAANIHAVRRMLDKARVGLAEDEIAGGDARVTEAERAFAKGKARYDAGDAGDAFTLFQEAQRIAQESKVLIQAHGELRVRVGFGDDADQAGDGNNGGATNAASTKEGAHADGGTEAHGILGGTAVGAAADVHLDAGH